MVVKVKRVGKTHVRLWLKHMRELLCKADMEHADFDGFDKRKVEGRSVTDFIKDRTSLWRKTWLIAPIERMIQELETFLNEEKKL